MKHIIEHIVSIQERCHYTDGEMALRLGCSRQLYQMTRTGRSPLGQRLLKGVVTAFPELKQDVIIFLSSGVGIKTAVADGSTTTPQRPPGRKLRGFGVFQALRHYLGVNILRSLKRG